MSRDWFEGWPGQYRRMLRWQKRQRAAREAGSSAEDVYDFLYAFFQSCYHLRDWLVATDACTQAEIERLFAGSVELRLCRDICNATKHLRYDRPSITPAPRIGREYDPWTKGPTDLFLYADERRPIGDLVNACVEAWGQFLSDKKLLDAHGKPIPFEPLPGPPPRP